MQIVWFKRDLRIQDHAPLVQAIEKGAVIPLYILEPKLWQQPDMSYRQYQFLRECLIDLDTALKSIGSHLVIRVGDALQILQELRQTYTVTDIWSHQETWNLWTYDRDRTVKKWTKTRDIVWHELPQHGIIRGLKNRDGWSAQWYDRMKKSIVTAPQSLIMPDILSDSLPTPEEIGLSPDGCDSPQVGGRQLAVQQLNRFLYESGQNYTKEMSSPLTAFNSCSRLSTYIAFGVISMKEVLHATDKRIAEIKVLKRGEKGGWGSAMRSFSGRLRWHCHFMQKLEDAPRIEFFNIHSAYEGLRDTQNQDYFEAWKTGTTGYPMVDACMRALIKTGWINFRMRAMLMSFSSYHLWLPWRESALYLARLFVDYEPGIHYSQVQMQSGTTGINSIRIYNPIKQGVDQDPDGIFIRQWLPELKDVPTKHIHMPWTASLSLNYPEPIVEEAVARKSAAAKIYAVRKSETHYEESKIIVQKHGSRKKTAKSSRSKPNKIVVNNQMVLPI